MARSLSFLAIAVILVTSSQMLLAEERPFVAVFGMEDRGSGLSSKTILNLTDYLSAKLVECGYKIIPQNQIKERLVEQKKESYKNCYDQGCQIELGRELSAQKTLSSQILKIGGTCQVTATLYDLKKAAAENAATGGGDCKEEALLNAINIIVAKLCLVTGAQPSESVKAINEFDVLLKDAQKTKEKKERASNAWATVRRMAKDEALPLSTRAELVKKFITAFKGDNPYESEALALFREVTPGSISINTNPPGALIKINGTMVGRSQLSHEIKAGRYDIVATMEGYADGAQTVQIDPAKETRVQLTLRNIQPGILRIATEPQGARVTVIDNASLQKASGEAPLESQLPAGTYSIKVETESYVPEMRAVTIEAGKRIDLKIALKQVPSGTLVVKTDPPGASIAVMGLSAGDSPITKELRPGSYDVEATMEGFEHASAEVEIPSGKTTEIALSLARIYPMNPLKKWGHIAFWSGVGVAAFGAGAAYLGSKYGDDDKAGDPTAASKSRTWTGLMYIGLGGGMTFIGTGLILWAVSPGDKEWFDSHPGSFAILPQPNGAVVSFTGSW